MTYEEMMEQMEAVIGKESSFVTDETAESAVDAMTFVKSLHQVFKDSGMTASEEPNLAEMENLFDSMLGELGAACLFLSAPSFERVPDMLRAIGSQLEKTDREDVPVVVKKGFERLAKRIENTRVQMQQLVKTSVEASDTP